MLKATVAVPRPPPGGRRLWRLSSAITMLRQLAGETDDDVPATGAALIDASLASAACGAAVAGAF